MAFDEVVLCSYEWEPVKINRLKIQSGRLTTECCDCLPPTLMMSSLVLLKSETGILGANNESRQTVVGSVLILVHILFFISSYSSRKSLWVCFARVGLCVCLCVCLSVCDHDN